MLKNRLICFIIIMTSIYSPIRSVLGYRLETSYRNPHRRFGAVYRSSYYTEGNHSNTLFGDILYVSGWSANGWLALDVSDPFRPRKVGWYEDSANIDRATHLSISQYGYGYCSSERANTITAIDLADPARMRTVASYCNHQLMNTPVASVVDEDVFYLYVIARGPYESVPGSTTRTTGDALLAFDIGMSGPESLTLRGYVQDHTYLRGPRHAIYNPDTNEVACACIFGKMVSVWNVYDPTNITLSYHIDLSGIPMSPHSLAWVPGTEYAIVVGGSSIASLNMNALGYGPIGSIASATGLNAAYSVAVKDGYAYIANRYGHSVTVYDVSEIDDLKYVTTVTDSDILGDAYYVTADPTRDVVYVSSFTGDAQVMLDVSDPTDLSLAGQRNFRPITINHDKLKTEREVKPVNRIRSMRSPGPSTHRLSRLTNGGNIETEFRPVEQWDMIRLALQSENLGTIRLTSGKVLYDSIVALDGTDFMALGVEAGQWIRVSGPELWEVNIVPKRVSSVSTDTIWIEGNYIPAGHLEIPLTIERNHIKEGLFSGLSMELERHYQDAGEYLWMPGQMVERWDLNFGVRAGSLMSTFRITGAGGYPLGVSQGVDWEDYTDEAVFGSKHILDLTFGGVSLLDRVTSFRVSVENSLDWHWTRSDPRPSGVKRVAESRIEGSISVYYDDHKALSEIIEGKAGELILTMQNAAQSFVSIYMPSVTAKVDPSPEGAGRAGEISYGWKLLTDASAGYRIAADMLGPITEV